MAKISQRTSVKLALSSLLLLPAIGLALLKTPQTASLQTSAKLSAQQIEVESAAEFSSDSEELSDRFSLPNALERLDQVKDALSSFNRLTEKSKPVLGTNAMTEIGNTDWETQNLGFRNWTSAIEGTLRHQDYQLKKLELELARKQYQDREITQVAFQEKQRAYQLAEQEHQAFQDSFQVVD